jgi:hypothetical protein
MGLMTKTTIENYRLREPFENWPKGSIVRVANAREWPPLQQFADRVDDAATWNYEFDAAFHAEIERIKSQPPPPRPDPDIRHDRLLKLFGWDDMAYATALRLGFPIPKHVGHEYEYPSHRPLRDGEQLLGQEPIAQWSLYPRRLINEWLADMQRLGSTLPTSI